MTPDSLPRGAGRAWQRTESRPVRENCVPKAIDIERVFGYNTVERVCYRGL